MCLYFQAVAVVLVSDALHWGTVTVKLGVRGEDCVEILQGVGQGENVVVSANFLIDAESNLKAALSRFTADSKQAPDAKP